MNIDSIKSIANTIITHTLAGAATIAGMVAADRLWNEKIEPAIGKKNHSNH